MCFFFWGSSRPYDISNLRMNISKSICVRNKKQKKKTKNSQRTDTDHHKISRKWLCHFLHSSASFQSRRRSLKVIILFWLRLLYSDDDDCIWNIVSSTHRRIFESSLVNILLIGVKCSLLSNSGEDDDANDDDDDHMNIMAAHGGCCLVVQYLVASTWVKSTKTNIQSFSTLSFQSIQKPLVWQVWDAVLG